MFKRHNNLDVNPSLKRQSTLYWEGRDNHNSPMLSGSMDVSLDQKNFTMLLEDIANKLDPLHLGFKETIP